MEIFPHKDGFIVEGEGLALFAGKVLTAEQVKAQCPFPMPGGCHHPRFTLWPDHDTLPAIGRGNCLLTMENAAHLCPEFQFQER